MYLVEKWLFSHLIIFDFWNFCIISLQMNEAERFNKKFPGQMAPRQSDFLRKRLQGKGGVSRFHILRVITSFAIADECF